MRTLQPFLLILTFSFSTAAYAAAPQELYKGLPDYDKHPAFTISAADAHNGLRRQILGISPAASDCKMTTVKAPLIDTVDLWSNVCDAGTYTSVRQSIHKLAPGLIFNNITFWITDLDGDKEPDLIAGHLDVSEDKEWPYPYLSLWRLKFENGKYTAVHAGPFLMGNVHSIRPFGNIVDRKTVFVRHYSCMECEPLTYLTPVDFDAPNRSRAYEFTYSEGHQNFSPELEYELPGMGHTVDAAVQTRTLPPSKDGPHLLQFFDIQDQLDEWWSFTCSNYRCDYRMYLKKPPDDFSRLWNKAEKL